MGMNDKIKMDVQTARAALIQGVLAYDYTGAAEQADLTFDQRIQLSIATSLHAITSALEEIQIRGRQ
jgi:hypothetical protein